MLNIFLMFEVFLVSSWDISHSQFGIQNQILVSGGYQDTEISDPVMSCLNFVK